MSLNAGTRLGPYEIVALLGAGGMGEVYRARDTKLGRDVAIKVLPDLFANDAERLARFQREAQVLASLNHPNIAQIYGLERLEGQEGPTAFIVMELVEGADLRQRIAHGPIPLDEALPIARQITEALEAAHEQGIIHRDLKPANIKVRPDGTVKVLDFGLAKAMAPASATSVNAMTSPTLSIHATQAGIILGTAAYMSPEQARGKAVDRRADIWAFGVVLYEMLTGRRAFEGDDLSITLASVLKTDPDWRRLPADTPEAVRRLLQRCLQKDPQLRLRDAADARFDLNDASKEPSAEPSSRPSRVRERVVWIAALALAVLISATAARVFTGRGTTTPEMRVEITALPTTYPASLAISPDGRKIVFTGTSEGQSRLWLRLLDAPAAKPLRGTDRGIYPFWSPDSRTVAFFADGKLKRMNIDGGSVETLATAAVSRGGAWNRDGVILFPPRGATPILRISANGGLATPVTRLQPQQSNHVFPQFLPDGRHFLYYAVGSPETSGVYAGQLDGSETRRLLEADAAAVYAPPGRLLFVRQGTLFSQDFDPIRMEMSGNPVAVAEQVASDVREWAPGVSASAAGPIIYRAGSAVGGKRQFVWFDRSGHELGNVGESDDAKPMNPSMSPDGRRVVLDRTVNGNIDTWLLDVIRGVRTRLTTNPAIDNYPIWSPDGSRVAFHSNRKGLFDLYEKPASGAGTEELLLSTPLSKTPMDWSPDGRVLLFRTTDPKTGGDLWALPLTGDRKPFPVVQTEFEEFNGQFSPDGKWIAYQSNESGRFEIYVQPFPGPGARFEISTTGGAQARWRADGRELFYLALDDRLMAVPITVTSDSRSIEAGAPVALFATRIGGAVQDLYMAEYMVSPGGQRFLMNTLLEEATTSPITLLVNWRPPGTER